MRLEPIASIHWRSSPGMKAATTLGVVKLSPRLVECAAVTPGASDRLTTPRFGTLVPGAGVFTAMSTSPPPGATPGLVVLPTLFAQPLVRIPQLSGWPSYLKGSVPSAFGGPSTALYQRCRSVPPGTPRIEDTYTVPCESVRTLGSRPRTTKAISPLGPPTGAKSGKGNSWFLLKPGICAETESKFIRRTRAAPIIKVTAAITRHANLICLISLHYFSDLEKLDWGAGKPLQVPMACRGAPRQTRRAKAGTWGPILESAPGAL